MPFSIIAGQGDSGAPTTLLLPLPRNSRAVAAAEKAAASGGGSYRDLLAWAYSPASNMTRADCDPTFLETFVTCPVGAQRVALGYLQGRVQQGMFEGLTDGKGRRSSLMSTVLREIAKQVSGASPFRQLEAFLSASAPGHPTKWHRGEVDSKAILTFQA